LRIIGWDPSAVEADSGNAAVRRLTWNLQSSVKNVFIRGSVVRYVHLPGAAVDTQLLEDATRREAAQQAVKAKAG
jgi:hypothetical protein